MFRGSVFIIVCTTALSLSDFTEQPQEEFILNSSSQENEQKTPNAQPFYFNPSGNWIETAAQGVAKLVSSSFSSSKPQPNRQATPDIMGNIFKILGLESSKLFAVAVNALIFLAQMISNILTKKGEESKKNNDAPPPGSPMTWIFDNSPPEAVELVRAAQEKVLPDKLIELLRDSARGETDCVQLLICKAGPIIWSMQQALATSPPLEEWPKMSPLERMFSYFPSLKELSENSTACNKRFLSFPVSTVLRIKKRILGHFVLCQLTLINNNLFQNLRNE